MNQPAYLFTRVSSERYAFTSLGKQKIDKAVEFTATDKQDLYNIAFGDQLPDGTIDDIVESNNGDIVKVLSTVVQILRTFTTEFHDATIVFVGSSEERTRLYRRILRNYYLNFSKEYIIAAFILSDGVFKEVPFDPLATAVEYHAFFVKKIS